MRVPLQWLRDHVDPQLELRELVRRLDLTGTAVDGVHHHGVRALEHFVVGKVLEAARHPNADRLSVCEVDVGDGGPQTIVCGAPNVAAGQTVAVARPGSVMPDGTELGVAKLRGVRSNGMICAEDELGIGGDHAGILVLDDALDAGTPLIDVLPIATEVLELEITPNRPDCLGVYGVAREVAAVSGAPLAAEPWAQDPHGPAPGPIPGFDVRVEVPDLCPRFTARLFEDVRIGPSPPWLKGRLTAAGMRPINNVVDITNYVMLLVGQPLHAFDADRIAGGTLVVRRAGDGERMTTLDDVERTLDAGMVLIADGDGPTSIAGIMGGQRSEVQDDTTRVLLEVATWDGPNINRTMARLGLRSEAGARFEKSLPPESAMWAQAVATTLMVELCGARVSGGTLDAGGAPAEHPVVHLRDARTAALLGVTVARERAAGVLRTLGFGVAEAADGLDVTIPPHRRHDVTREADLVEEVGRLAALEDLPSTLPQNRTGLAATLTQRQRLRRRAVDALVGRGAHEVVGWSFTSRSVADRLGLPDDDFRRDVVALENPMSEEQAVLRTTLLGSLLDVAGHNAARGQHGLALFEEGAVYFPRSAPAFARGGGDGPAFEVRALGALVGADVFAAKALLEAVGAAVRVGVEVEQSTEPFLHPGRAARVVAGPLREGPDAERPLRSQVSSSDPRKLGSADDVTIGWLGEVHPTVSARWDLGQVSAFEVDLDALLDHAAATPQFEDLTTFPEVRQDLSFLLDADVPAARLRQVVRRAGGDLLAGAEVYDWYAGQGIPEGKRSLTLALSFRAQDRTLSDEDVAPVRGRIVDAVSADLGGELRGG